MKNCILVLLVAAIVSGCATPPKGAELVDRPDQLTPIQQVYADRLAQVNTGMDLQEFQNIFPESYVGGQSGLTTAYELTREAQYVTQSDIDRQNFLWGAGSPRAKSERQTLWFYFYDSKLVKWGRPGDWPKEPDTIIEVK